MERFQTIAGATSGHRGAATTRGHTHKQGVKCVVANTYGMFHTRSEHQHAQLARGSGTTPEAPEACPGVLQGVQDLIAELVAKGYRNLFTDGSSKRLSHRDMRRAGGFPKSRPVAFSVVKEVRGRADSVFKHMP